MNITINKKASDQIVLELSIFYFYFITLHIASSVRYRFFKKSDGDNFCDKNFADILQRMPHYKRIIKSKQINVSVRELYNQRKEEYKRYTEIMWSRENVQNSLLWRFNKKIAELTGNKDNFFVMMFV